MIKLKKIIGSFIWNLSEDGVIPPIGKYAPKIFGWMIGSKVKKL